MANTTWQDLAGLNPQISNPNLIYPGQQILLPDFTTYTVRSGDTLSGIAANFNKQQAIIEVDPEDNLAVDPDLPDEEPLSDEEEENQDDKVEDDEAGPTEANVRDFMDRHPDESSESNSLAIGDNQKTTQDPAANPLDAYASYTYGLSLFALTKADYNRMIDAPEQFEPSKCLISSAGRYQNIRDSHFKEDFYFDSFKLTTIIGMGAATRGTNAINMDFTIIEPYGMTLMDRIMDISMNELSAQNYLDIPYLLRLDFFGYDDNGNIQKITSQTKNFPIKLLGLKIKASVKGSEYAIQAVPFNHGANMQSIQALKTRMEITATTVNDFFANTDDPKVAADADAYRQSATASAAYSSGERGAGGGRGTPGFKDPRLLGSTGGDQPGVESVTPGPFKTTSFTAAYNAWNNDTTKTKDARFADTIRFVIDPKIGNSKIVDPKKNSVKRAGATTAKKEAQAAEGKDSATLNTDTIVHSFEAGTSVNEIINAIIPNSEFFLKQVKDPSKQGKTETENSQTSDSTSQEQATTLKMWKIIPKLKLRDFDTERNLWGKEITFFVKLYDVYQQRDKRLPKSPPPTKPAKRYDYFYTGKNSSVIGFDIDFNALYYTAQQVDRGNTVQTAGPAAKPDDSDNDSIQKNSGKVTISPIQQQNTGSQMQSGVGGANNRGETQNAQSALQSVYTSAAGDMVKLKLQIIGDPHFIKQDDLYISPEALMGNPTSGTSNMFVSNAVESINMDDGEIFCYVTFRTPVDFNDETGMYNLKGSNKYQVSEFSGYYKVIQVDSEFRGGKFTQTLELIRVDDQDSPNASAAQNSTLDSQRKESKAVNPAVAKNLPSESAVETPDQESPSDAAESGPDSDSSPDETPAYEVTEADDDADIQSEDEADLGDVADFGDTFSVDEASSYDGNTIPIQTA